MRTVHPTVHLTAVGRGRSGREENENCGETMWVGLWLAGGVDGREGEGRREERGDRERGKQRLARRGRSERVKVLIEATEMENERLRRKVRREYYTIPRYSIPIVPSLPFRLIALVAVMYSTSYF